MNKIEAVNPKLLAVSVPDGLYEGNWGGYAVTFKVGETTYEAETKIGIRAMNFPVTVLVNSGIISVVERVKIEGTNPN